MVIPTFNAAARLPACLEALVPASVNGLLKEVIVSDGGSTDATAAIAEAAGCIFLGGEKSRGGQLMRGATQARGRSLLFLHADTILDPTWTDDVKFLIGDEARAGVFTLAFDARGAAPRIVAWGAMTRTRVFKTPYGDQGFFISKALYEKLGGYRDTPIFEDVDLIDRLVRHGGRRSLVVFPSRATTSADRYLKDGYLPRVLKNFACLAMYRTGVSVEKIAAFYQS